MVAELNSTSPSTSELGEFVDEAESDEANADNADDEDAVEDILYMRGATFTIHLDALAENSTANSTKINEVNGADRIELRATSQVTLPAIFPGLACRIAARVCTLLRDHLLCRIPEQYPVKNPGFLIYK